MFMENEGEDWIMFGLFIHDMIHASTSDALLVQFIREYQADFNITLEDVMSSFLGMDIEHKQMESRDPNGYIYLGDAGRVQGVHHEVPQA
jgi:hypothetical protein